MTSPPVIALTTREQELCSVLVQAGEALRTARPETSPPTLRIAGGWVRDKLLGLESHDLDLALDTISGQDFAQHVNAFLAARGIPTRSIGVVAVNPDRSKHLETAKCQVLGLEVDFVNLRAEDYSDASRIPVMRFGTPLQDALRRDLTINALFYNLHTRAVEDFTGRGLDDLERRIVRTPLPPHQTFLDDPLRVLRTIRFACRFGFDMADGIREAAMERSVCDALAVKVSRERIGDELSKAVRSAKHVRAILQYLVTWGYYPLVFAPAASEHVDALWRSHELFGAESDPIEQVAQKLPFAAPLALDPARRLQLVAAFWLLPLAGQRVTLPGPKKQSKAVEVSLVHHVVKSQLKWAVDDADTVERLHEAVEIVWQLAEPAACESLTRASAAAAVAKLGGRPLGDAYALAFVVAALQRIYQSAVDGTCVSVEAATAPLCALYNRLQGLGVTEAHRERPLLNGKRVAELLHTKPGPQIGQILQDLLLFQYANPGVSAGECEQWLLTQSSYAPAGAEKRCE